MLNTEDAKENYGKMKVTDYQISTKKEAETVIALVADLHDKPYHDLLVSFEERKPDVIAICGDLLYAAGKEHNIFIEDPQSAQHLRDAKYALRFLEEIVQKYTVLFSTGNHELHFDKSDRQLLNQLGVIFLDNQWCRVGQILFGGLSSPFRHLKEKIPVNHTEKDEKVLFQIVETEQLEWMDAFEKENGYKVLLCHHPELYKPFLKERNIDLILSGHTHGGQIRVLGKGIFAHGQGLFPQYDGGIYDDKLIVSRGLANTSKRVPRLCNPTELVYVTIKKDSK